MIRILGVFVLFLLVFTSCVPEVPTDDSDHNVDTLYISSSDTLVKVDTIKTITFIETYDTILLRDSIFQIDTIHTTAVESIITVDTVTTEFIDTIHVVDTLYINDTSDIPDTVYVTDSTKYYGDTVYVNGAGKTTFLITANLDDSNFTTPQLFTTIRCHNFTGEFPELIEPEGRFTVDENGALFVSLRTSVKSMLDVVPYTIALAGDTLHGAIVMSDLVVDSVLINDSLFVRPGYTDSIWRIPYDWGEAMNLSWDLNNYVDHNFTGSYTPFIRDYSEWYDTSYYNASGDENEYTGNTGIKTDVVDPLLMRFCGTFDDLPQEQMKAHASSKSMESFLIGKSGFNRIEVFRPVDVIDGLYYIGPSGWTAFHDTTNPTVKFTPTVGTGYDSTTLQSITIQKNGAGYGIAQGFVGFQDSACTMQKLKQVYIRYTVYDRGDTVSLGISSGVSAANDTNSWNCFRAVLTTGRDSVGHDVIDILDLEDFYISWEDADYPLGTTLADDIAQPFLATANGITFSQENEDPLDTSFSITIHELYFVGESGFFREAIRPSSYSYVVNSIYNWVSIE